MIELEEFGEQNSPEHVAAINLVAEINAILITAGNSLGVKAYVGSKFHSNGHLSRPGKPRTEYFVQLDKPDMKPVDRTLTRVLNRLRWSTDNKIDPWSVAAVVISLNEMFFIGQRAGIEKAKQRLHKLVDKLVGDT